MNYIPAPFEAAKRIINERFPLSDAALLAGSVVRGEATTTSDLDIVVFDSKVPAPYRESLRALGWPVEVFVHNLHSYKQFFESDAKRARPSLPRMVFRRNDSQEQRDIARNQGRSSKHN